MKKYLAAGSVAALILIAAPMVYYSAPGGTGCARCHEMEPVVSVWHASSHRNIDCSACHGDALNPKFHLTNARRLASHLKDEVPDRIHLGQEDVFAMVERCRGCHQQQFADWQAGPHAATYSRIFLDKAHNEKRLLMDDCLRCHGMHFEGGIRDLVEPVSARGPWSLKDADLANRPSIPCLACHEMHRDGRLRAKAQSATKEETVRASLALFDRRERMHQSAAAMALPVMTEGARAVKMSPDARQALCYQCHAPLALKQVRSGDDRTPTGVHEGISCLACHDKHAQTTRASCSTCHPKMSNCGLDVEKMDTTFFNKDSRHNIHSVKCADCHEKGVPRKRLAGQAASARDNGARGGT